MFVDAFKESDEKDIRVYGRNNLVVIFFSLAGFSNTLSKQRLRLSVGG